MPRIIEIVISPTGTATVQTKGYAGSSCQQASKWLEDALGITTAECKTPEFYQTEAAQQQIQQ